MKIQSNQVGQKLTVAITEVSNNQSIIDTIESCADGHCACSSDEYQKVESLKISRGSNFIQLDIAVKPGETIDSACISECLDPDSHS